MMGFGRCAEMCARTLAVGSTLTLSYVILELLFQQLMKRTTETLLSYRHDDAFNM